MLFLIWIVVGGILGWLASVFTKADAEQDMLLNIVVGIIGAFLGGWLFAPLFSPVPIDTSDFGVASLVVAFLGAVFLLAVVNLLNRSSST